MILILEDSGFPAKGGFPTKIAIIDHFGGFSRSLSRNAYECNKWAAIPVAFGHTHIMVLSISCIYYKTEDSAAIFQQFSSLNLVEIHLGVSIDMGVPQ